MALRECNGSLCAIRENDVVVSDLERSVGVMNVIYKRASANL